MTNEDILEAIEPKRRSNGRVYNGDLKSYGLQLLKTREDLSELIIGKNQDVDFVFFHAILTRDKKNFRKHLEDIDPYLDTFDSWDDTDNIITHFKKPIDFDFFYKMVERYLKSDNPYVRRLGYVGFIKADLRPKQNCYQIIKLFKNTQEHTLIMAQGWLMAEMYINNPKLMYDYFMASNLSYKILSTAISKCTDSFRISPAEKTELRKIRTTLKQRRKN